MKKLLILGLGLAACIGGCKDKEPVVEKENSRLELAVEQAKTHLEQEKARLEQEKAKVEQERAVLEQRKARLESAVITKNGQVVEGTLRTECQIRDIMQGSVGLGFDGGYGIHHDIVYVYCTNPEKALTLIYPHSRMLRRGIVDVQYKPIEGGRMSSHSFVKEHVKVRRIVNKDTVDLNKNNKNLRIDLFQIYADGIILEDGIRYK